MGTTRRSFLRHSAYFAAGAGLSGPLSSLAANVAHASPARLVTATAADHGGYGPLVPAAGGALKLPSGFTYRELSKVGSQMSSGQPVPPGHDGQAVFAMDDGMLRLVRNHELGSDGTFGARPYDNYMGGCTTVVIDPDTGQDVVTHPTQTGTIGNCGGGPTPWGSWLTCEETTRTGATGLPHGYVFEVPAEADEPVDAVPLKAMGRFKHEAVAVDPLTGTVYETEDQTLGGFYRFRPSLPGDLARGGTLEMMSVPGAPDTRRGQTVGATRPVTWVPIVDPDPDDRLFQATQGQTIWGEGVLLGGSTFARGEGAWTGVENLPDQTQRVTIYFACTSGGDAGVGQIWAYRPGGDLGGELTLLFESPGREVLAQPDNLCVHPPSGLVLLMEDGGVDDGNGNRRQRVHVVTADGQIFPFAEQSDAEFAGGCFSPDGKWFFVNVQGRGTTYAITGPWDRGVLAM